RSRISCSACCGAPSCAIAPAAQASIIVPASTLRFAIIEPPHSLLQFVTDAWPTISEAVRHGRVVRCWCIRRSRPGVKLERAAAQLRAGSMRKGSTGRHAPQETRIAGWLAGAREPLIYSCFCAIDAVEALALLRLASSGSR